MTKNENSPTVTQTPAGTWIVVTDDHQILAEFQTNREAWRYLDQHERRELWATRKTADWTGKGVYYPRPKPRQP